MERYCLFYNATSLPVHTAALQLSRFSAIWCQAPYHDYSKHLHMAFQLRLPVMYLSALYIGY